MRYVTITKVLRKSVVIRKKSFEKMQYITKSPSKKCIFENRMIQKALQ